MRTVRWIAVMALVASAACSKGTGSVSVADAKRWTAITEARHLTTRLVALVGQAEQSVRILQAQDLSTQSGHNYLSGAQTSWQNVLAQTYNFGSGGSDVGQTVPSMASTVADAHQAAVQWLDVIDQVQRSLAAGHKLHSIEPIAGRRIDEGKLEGALRAEFLKSSAELALEICHLEQRNPGLAASGSAAGDCTAARSLAAQT